MLCHICSKECLSFREEKGGIVYYHCGPCEYIFKSPEHYQDFASQKERYNLHQNNSNDTGYQAYFQRFIDFVLPQVGTVKSALDFGCGESTLLASMLEKRGIDTDYYDPIYHPNISSDIKKYQLILSCEVFEHLHAPQEVFSSLINRLEVGGYLAIQTQFHSNEIEEFKKWYYHQDPTHIVFFRLKTFEILASKLGAKVIAENSKNMLLIHKL